MSEAFRIDLSLFEGPLDLLLHLVRRHDIDLRELPVAEIAEQYVAFLDSLQALDLELASEYLVTAATLVWLKSRALLPRDDPEAEAAEDLRRELIERLLDYERFKLAAGRLDDRPRLGRDHWGAAVERPPADPDGRPWAPVSLHDLVDAFAQVLKRMPDPAREAVLRYVLPERTIEEGAAALARHLERRPRATLVELLGDSADRADLVVRFLALLELIRVGALQALAESDSDVIWIVRPPADGAPGDFARMVRGAYGPEPDQRDS